jgi:hypothetical protein
MAERMAAQHDLSVEASVIDGHAQITPPDHSRRRVDVRVSQGVVTSIEGIR